MKYMYILLSILSSFFIHKSLYAKDIELQYAFFVPTGAFQENTTINDIKLQARYPKKNNDIKNNTVSNDTNKEDLSPSTQYKNNLRRKISLPVERRKLKKSVIEASTHKDASKPQNKPKKYLPEPHPKNILEPEIVTITQTPPTEIATPSNASEAYELEENIPVLTAEHIVVEETPEEIETPKTKPMLNTTEQLLNADIHYLLNTIEQIDTSKPLFQQLYSLYGAELRSLYRNNRLPPNLSLDASLKKANSLLRFEVK